MAVNIAFASDTRAFLKGTGDIEKAMDDVADSLDDVGRSGKDIDGTIGRSLKNVGDDAQAAGKEIGTEIKQGTEKAEDSVNALERKFRNAFDDVKVNAKTVGGDVGDNVKRGFDNASDGVSEFRDEANGTAREVAASFDGSAESIQGGFQEVAANAFAGFGPAGMAAGLVAAAGIGLISKEMQEAKEEAERLKERVGELAAAIVEAGNASEPLAENFAKQMQDWVLGGEVMGKSYQQAKDELDTLGFKGTEVDTILRGMVGGPQEMHAATELLRRKQEEVAKEFDAGNRTMSEGYSERMRSVMEFQGTVASEQQAIATANAMAQEAARQTGRVTREEQAAIQGGYDNFRAPRVVVETDASGIEREINRVTSKTYSVNVSPRLNAIAVP